MQQLTIRALAGLALLALISACNHAPLYKVSASAATGQQLIYADGRPVLISRKKTTVVASPVTYTIARKGDFKVLVSIKNDSNETLDVSSESMTVSYKNVEHRPVPSHEQLLLAVERQRSNEELGAALTGIANGLATGLAGYNYSQGNVQGTITATQSGEVAHVNGSYTENSYNSGQTFLAITAAQNQERQLAQDIETSYRSRLNGLDGYFKRQTLFPGTTYSGFVTVFKSGRLPEGQLWLQVNVAGESHEFAFSTEDLRETASLPGDDPWLLYEACLHKPREYAEACELYSRNKSIRVCNRELACRFAHGIGPDDEVQTWVRKPVKDAATAPVNPPPPATEASAAPITSTVPPATSEEAGDNATAAPPALAPSEASPPSF